MKTAREVGDEVALEFAMGDRSRPATYVNRRLIAIVESAVVADRLDIGAAIGRAADELDLMDPPGPALAVALHALVEEIGLGEQVVEPEAALH